jgi:hypothetical protein
MPAATRHALDPGQSVRYLRREVGLSEVDLADGTGAHTRTVRRWIASRPSEPQPRYARHIDDLKAIVEELEDSLTHKGIRQWLRARSRYLDDKRPIDELREGHFDEVRQAARAFTEGYYL